MVKDTGELGLPTFNIIKNRILFIKKFIKLEMYLIYFTLYFTSNYIIHILYDYLYWIQYFQTKQNNCNFHLKLLGKYTVVK